MSLLAYSFIPNAIINGFVEKCKSLLPGSGNREEAKIVIAEGSKNSHNPQTVKTSFDIIKGLNEKGSSFAVLFFAVVVKLLFNKAVKNGRHTKLADVIYSMKEYMKSSKSIQEAALKYSKKSSSFIIDMSIIVFFSQFFGKMMKQFLEDINQGIYYTLCLKLHLPSPIYLQRISEFKVTIGEDLMAAKAIGISE